MSDVVISYSRQDSAWVDKFVLALEAEDFTVWLDRKSLAGLEIRKTVEDEIKIAKAVLVIWSETSVQSSWVIDEIDKAKKRNILIPIKKDEVNIPAGFGQMFIADLTNWNESRSHPEFERVVKSIRGLKRPASPETDRLEAAQPSDVFAWAPPPPSAPSPTGGPQGPREPSRLTMLVAVVVAIVAIVALTKLVTPPPPDLFEIAAAAAGARETEAWVVAKQADEVAARAAKENVRAPLDGSGVSRWSCLGGGSAHYEGTWRRHRKAGLGKQTLCPIGNTFTGEFLDGHPNGLGVYRVPTGITTAGVFVTGHIFEGVRRWSEAGRWPRPIASEAGRWALMTTKQDYALSGPGKVICRDQTYFKGYWVSGGLSGPGTRYASDGKILEHRFYRPDVDTAKALCGTPAAPVR